MAGAQAQHVIRGIDGAVRKAKILTSSLQSIRWQANAGAHECLVGEANISMINLIEMESIQTIEFPNT